MTQFNLFDFKFGKLKRKFSYYLKLSVILNTAVDIIALLPGIDEKKAFNAIDVTQKFLNIDYLNDYIIKDERFLGYRIERVLDNALKEAMKKKR